MLVLTRRSKDKISFPQVGITVHFVRVQSGHVKVGVDAPRDIAIVRDEVDELGATADLVRRQLLRLPREIRHGIRNELHELSVGLHLYKELIAAGLEDEAAETFGTLQNALKRLDENEVLQRPENLPNSSAAGLQGGAIALLEDDANERELLAGFLRLKGYQVITFEDGQRALDHFSEMGAPGIVLVDMHMPRCDGPTTVRTLREIELFNSTPIFAISGTTPEEFGLQLGQSGVDRWFPKPLNPESLIEAIERSLPDCSKTVPTSSSVDAR